jgi:mitochondrial Rho GTPase 1
LNLIPTIYAATKADLDRQEQRCPVQPDTYTRHLGLQPPIHVSALWGATGDLFVQLAEAASWPGTAVPR